MVGGISLTGLMMNQAAIGAAMNTAMAILKKRQLSADIIVGDYGCRDARSGRSIGNGLKAFSVCISRFICIQAFAWREKAEDPLLDCYFIKPIGR